MKIKKILLLASFLLVFPLQVWAQSYDSNAVSKYNEGVDYSNKGQYQLAIDAFKDAISIDPTFTDAYYNLGTVYEFLKDSNNALFAYKEALKRNPEDSETAYKIANIYYNQGHSQKAISYIALIPPGSPRYAKAKEIYKKASSNLSNARSASVSTRPAYPVSRPTVAPSQPKKVIYKQFLAPTGITRDLQGNVYVANYANNSIVKIDKYGQRHVFLKGGLLKGPLGLACDTSDNIYVANYLSNQILKVSPQAKVSVFMTDVKKPYYLYMSHDVLYVSEQGNNSMLKYDLK